MADRPDSGSESQSDRRESDAGVVVPLPTVKHAAEQAGHAGEEDEEGDVDLGELRVALEDLRREIRSRIRGSDSAEPDSIDWIELFGELRRRVNTFGMVERSGVVDEFGLDEIVLKRSGRLLDFLFDRYWSTLR